MEISRVANLADDAVLDFNFLVAVADARDTYGAEVTRRAIQSEGFLPARGLATSSRYESRRPQRDRGRGGPGYQQCQEPPRRHEPLPEQRQERPASVVRGSVLAQAAGVECG
jgi:hypothetical protein